MSLTGDKHEDVEVFVCPPGDGEVVIQASSGRLHVSVSIIGQSERLQPVILLSLSLRSFWLFAVKKNIENLLSTYCVN